MSPIPTDPNQAQAWITGDPPDQTIDFYIPRGNTGPMGPVGPQGPSLAVGSVETNMGPAAPGTVGPQGLTGPKGDPGGFNTGTDLGTNDLNNITIPGLYRQANTANATLINNYPVATQVGVLTVTEQSAGATGGTHQSFSPSWGRDGRVIYNRTKFNGTWTAWRTFSSNRVDQTAGRAIYQWDDVNNREQLIYGDTGWRNVNSTVDANFVPEGIGVQFRRVGSRVTCDVRGKITTASGTQQLICNIPSGFRGVNYGMYPSGMRGTSVVSLGYPSDNIALWMYSTTAMVAASTYIAQATWTTDEPWPTTLPGTASGTIPNV